MKVKEYLIHASKCLGMLALIIAFFATGGLGHDPLVIMINTMAVVLFLISIYEGLRKVDRRIAAKKLRKRRYETNN